MGGSWVLVLLGLGGAWALPAPLSYPQALALAVDSYNQRPDAQKVFRLLSSDPEPTPDVELTKLKTLNFSLMETECGPIARANPDDCDFKENGVIKECSGPVKFFQSSSEIDLRCVDVSSDPVLVQRGRFGRFLSRVRRFRPRISFNLGAHGSIGLG
ncbi:cathelicidin-2-like [Cuculus canorus]|uniref:cathelicidin-2-like n=1 Tax=Cuculus canorus TaxID=55661 RepID=UPI0023AB01CB|nr:cathelicidin-2-like [Cuculus canorus]